MKISVVGAGSWGTAIAYHLKSRHEVEIWCRREEIASEISRGRSPYLPGFDLRGIRATTDINSLSGEIIVFAVPSKWAVDVLNTMSPKNFEGKIFLSLTKGLVNKKFLSDVIPFDVRYSVLSGPSFASEVASGHPTAAVVASFGDEAKVIQKEFSFNRFRIYTSKDVKGVQLCGAAKNVIAIAAGISDGLGFGFNTRSALITRGLHEIKKLGMTLGAKERTFYGLAGMGDLVLTCTSNLSRNRTLGLMIGKGVDLENAVKRLKGVAEGIYASKELYELSKNLGVDVPITKEVYEIIHNGKDPRQSIRDILSRPLKEESK